jgi:uncharacterized protein YjbI with pentapeptide repeats
MRNPKNIHTILINREVEGIRVAIDSSTQSKIIDKYVDSEIENNGIDFSFLDLRSQADKIKEYLKERDLEGVNLKGMNFEGSNLNELNFWESNLKEANFKRTYLVKADLANVNLCKANLTEANLNEARLLATNLTEANLTKAILANAVLTKANLSKANLESANLRGAKLWCVNLIGADLRGAHLLGANLTRADLRGAHLLGANLTGADLRGANFEGANLEGANLGRANLGRANLEGADLRDVNLEGVIQNTFSALNNSTMYNFSNFLGKTLSSLLYLLKEGILPDDQIKSMLKVEGTPLSEQLRIIVDNLKITIDEYAAPANKKYLIEHLSEDDKKKISDFIDIIATKEKKIKDKEIPVPAPAIRITSPSHESVDRVAKKQRVGEGGARGD